MGHLPWIYEVLGLILSIEKNAKQPIGDFLVEGRRRDSLGLYLAVLRGYFWPCAQE